MFKKYLIILPVLLLIGLAGSPPIKGQEDVTVQNINFGELMLGSEVAKEDLQDCVVGVDFDGMTCATCPCGGAINTFIEWHQKYSPQGFILLSFYVKDEAKEKFAAFCKSKKVPFPVYAGGSISGMEITDFPTFVIFDHNGKVIYNGHPKESGGKFTAAMKSMPDPLLGADPYKKLSALADKVKKRKELGQILAALKAKHLNSEDADEKAEAERLTERLTRYGNKLLRQAGAKKAKEPLECLNRYQQAATLYKGDAIGDTAEKDIKELKDDKVFQDNLKADKELADIIIEMKKLKPCNSCASFSKDCPACYKRNASMEVLIPKAKGLVKKYPDSPAAVKVKELLPVE
ncbi:MAG: hypothetical protein HZA49_02105 [Planctomycetes bacterium]|nr:hypothetical protein [Planctomycetota bacterium]